MFVTTGLSKCTLILKFVITKYNLLVATTPAPPPLSTFSVRYFAMTCFSTDCFTTILVNGKLRKYCVRAREVGFGTIFNYFLDVVYAWLTSLSCQYFPLILYLPIANFKHHFWRPIGSNPEYSVPHFKMTSKIFKNKITLLWVLTTFYKHTATITFADVWREATLQIFSHLHVKNTNIKG